MRLLNNKLSPIAVFLIAILMLVVIGFIDYESGSEISPLLMYLVPIIFVGLHTNSNKKIILIIALISGIIWLASEYLTRDYSNQLFLFWNSIVRIIIFIFLGMLLRILKDKNSYLKKVNLELNELNNEKNKFIGIAAHDIKNPVETINSFAKILKSNFADNLSEQVKEIHNNIEELSSNTLEILDNILDVSKIESGILEIKAKNQDYIRFINKQIFYNQIIASKKDIKIILDTDITDLLFTFDEIHLSVVLNNLLSNAIKYSDFNKTIYVKISEKENNIIKTEIIDSGKGIPLNEQSKLFNYFQKTSTQPTAGEQSTGLGLAISKKIIKEHNGTIGFESELNKGSTFYFELNKYQL